MLVLGIESSGRAGSVALRADGVHLAERSLRHSSRRHAQTLLSELDRLLNDCGRRARDCDVVAVSRGPGSFTGLRVGIVCAKTLAYAAGSRLAAVDTFEAVAVNCPAAVGQVTVIGNAQRSELFAGQYRRDGDRWARAGEIAIVAAQHFLRSLPANSAITGPGLQGIDVQWTSHLQVLAPAAWRPAAATVAWLGEGQVAAGRDDEYWSLEPFYLRRSAAEEKWDQARSGSP